MAWEAGNRIRPLISITVYTGLPKERDLVLKTKLGGNPYCMAELKSLQISLQDRFSINWGEM